MTRLVSTFVGSIVLSVPLFTACDDQVDPSWSVEDKAAEAQAHQGKADGVDVCVAWDWYDDDYCDDPHGWCALPDPDCGPDGDSCPEGMSWSGLANEGCVAQTPISLVFADPEVIGDRALSFFDSRAFTDIAVDDSGDVHVVYSDTFRRPVYATSSEAWTPHLLGENSYVREGLALEAKDEVYVATILDDLHGRLYQIEAGEIVHTEEVAAYARSIQLGLASDAVHVIFGAGDLNTSIAASSGTPGSMSTQTIVDLPNIDEAPEAPAVVVDSTGGVHAVYGTRPVANNTGASAQLRYAHRDTQGVWTDQAVANATLPGGAVASDGDGNPYAVYRAFLDGAATMMFAEQLNGAWQVSPLLAPGAQGSSASIVATPQGVLHVMYLASGDLYYVHRDLEGSWSQAQQLDSGVSMVDYDRIALAIDSEGLVHAVYADLQSLEVRYLSSTAG